MKALFLLFLAFVEGSGLVPLRDPNLGRSARPA